MLQLFEHIVACLGETCESSAFAELCRVADEEPIVDISYRNLRHISYNFIHHGIKLNYRHSKAAFDRADLFTTPYNEFAIYNCDLPNHASVTDKKIDILRKFGKPYSADSFRRTLPVPENPTKQEWKDFLALQREEPFTLQNCAFVRTNYRLCFWFDDDQDGRMTSVTLTHPANR